jgi:hypothetical protein
LARRYSLDDVPANAVEGSFKNRQKVRILSRWFESTTNLLTAVAGYIYISLNTLQRYGICILVNETASDFKATYQLSFSKFNIINNAGVKTDTVIFNFE